jgi:CRISPR-associated protein Csd2
MKNRYDFLYLFDAQDANPNGDPDAGNLPRIDVESGQGLVTDVCLKRKIRNFIQTAHEDQKIYFTEGAIHNNQHDEAYSALKSSGEITEEDLKKDNKKKPKPEIKDKATRWMCENFFDVRTFGAVMSTDINCGQVRGPVQISFARSIDPIISSEHAITRTSVTKPEDIQKERTMGRKFTIPYGLYKAQGFVNPFLAAQTGFSDDDLELLFTALENAFQFDQSAARPAGSMNPRALLVFKHDSALGSAPSHKLFETVKIVRKPGVEVARSFADYDLTVDESAIPDGVTLIRRI